MPRDSAGVFTLVPGYLAVTGQTIQASQHNPPLEDIATGLTGSLPRNGSAPMLGDLDLGSRKVLNSGTATNPNDLVSLSQMQAAIAAAIAPLSAVPPGVLAAYISAAPVPAGWLLADGSAVSRTTYAALWVAMGSPNTGNGTTTFTLPDLRGEFLRFWDNGRGVDPGRVFGSFQAGGIQSHSHGVTDSGHAHTTNAPFFSYTSASSGANVTAINTVGSANVDAAFTGISIQATGGTETRPRNIAYSPIIKT